MDRRERRGLTKEAGLEALYRIFKFFTGSEYLHYGRFEIDIPADVQHLKKAQERYLERLIEIVPPSVKSILDVGAGSGKTAEVLLERGFAVDCVSPGKALGDVVEARLGDRSILFRGLFEDVTVPKNYDLVLFSESFQYIPIHSSIPKAISLLNPGGHILICDFFRRPDAGRSAVRGGHALDAWERYYAQSPLELVVTQDITRETAPVYDIVNRFNQEVLGPISESAGAAAMARWPFLSRAAGFLFRRDIARLREKRLSGRATAEEFARSKAYRVYLFKHRPD